MLLRRDNRCRLIQVALPVQFHPFHRQVVSLPTAQLLNVTTAHPNNARLHVINLGLC